MRNSLHTRFRSVAGFLPLGLFTLLMALLPLRPAAATDGVIEINAASVAAAGGFPFSIASAGSYRLTSNLVVTGITSAIVATADDVTIDLNGFSIRGPVSCTHDGGNPGLVSCTGSSFGPGIAGAAVVRNGTIQGFSVGVESRSGQALVVERLISRSHTFAGIAPGEERLHATDCVISTIGGDGIEGQTPNGVKLIHRCVFEKIGDDGVYLDAGLISESTFTQIAEAVRSRVNRGGLIENSYFERNGATLTLNPLVGYRSNVFHSNGTGPDGGTNLGQNLCDGVPCP